MNRRPLCYIMKYGYKAVSRNNLLFRQVSSRTKPADADIVNNWISVAFNIFKYLTGKISEFRRN